MLLLLLLLLLLHMLDLSGHRPTAAPCAVAIFCHNALEPAFCAELPQRTTTRPITPTPHQFPHPPPPLAPPHHPPSPPPQVDTRQTGLAFDRPVTLLLAYLRSYRHMGVARVTCGNGCSCEARDVDGHQDVKESTTHLHGIEVGRAAGQWGSMAVCQRAVSSAVGR